MSPAYKWDDIYETYRLLGVGSFLRPPGGNSGYREGWGFPVWRDEFDGPLDLDRWYRRGLPGSDYYLSGTDRQGIIVRDNAYTEDGRLVIRTERRDSPLTPDAYTRWWDTAYIDTMPRPGFAGFEQRYGRWEARIHSLTPGEGGTPASSGIWSAFWLRTIQDGGEIDIMEQYGTPAGMNEDGTPGTFNYSQYWPNNGSGSQCVFFEQTGQTSNAPGNAFHQSRYPLPAPYSGWHTYACEWTPNRISCYCNDIMVGQVERGKRPVNFNGTPNANLADGALILDGGFGEGAKAHIRMDVHVGSNAIGLASVANTISPYFILFDYVRVWEWDGQE